MQAGGGTGGGGNGGTSRAGGTASTGGMSGTTGATGGTTSSTGGNGGRTGGTGGTSAISSDPTIGTIKNPVLKGYWADPQVALFNGKFYIYPTTDGIANWGATVFHAFSSPDLASWKDEGIILDRAAAKEAFAGFLAGGTYRYSELHRTIDGISQKMLTQTLRDLESNGLVLRKVYPEVPPRTEYSLTPLGLTLTEPLGALCAWAERHLPELEKARQKHSLKGKAMGA